MMNQTAAEITNNIIVSMVENNKLSLTPAGKTGSTNPEDVNKFAVEQIQKAYKEIYHTVLNP